MINPRLLEDVKKELSHRGFDYSITVEDVQRSIDNERCKDCVKSNSGFDYTVYHTYEEVSNSSRGEERQITV